VVIVNKNSYIYQIKNIINNKAYIGNTNNFKRRKKEHIYHLNNSNHYNKYLQRLWDKYGKENFKFTILETTTLEKQYKLEQSYLNKLKPFNNKGYNILTEVNNMAKCKIIKECVFCKQDFESFSFNQKYCDWCRSYQNNNLGQIALKEYKK